MPDGDVLVSGKFNTLVADTKNSVTLYSGPLRDQIADLLKQYDQIVFFVSLGAEVRLIAPFLKSKDEDPGVLAIDDAGQYVIAVLSGHVGGANACAELIAERLVFCLLLTKQDGHSVMIF